MNFDVAKYTLFSSAIVVAAWLTGWMGLFYNDGTWSAIPIIITSVFVLMLGLFITGYSFSKLYTIIRNS